MIFIRALLAFSFVFNPVFAKKRKKQFNDPLVSKQWALTSGFAGINFFQAYKKYEKKVKAPIIVAVIDSGIDIHHEDLKHSIFVNKKEIPNNGKDDDNNGAIDDTTGFSFWFGSNKIVDHHGHGTHVAGIIAASANNAKGIVGVADRVKILPVGCFYTDQRQFLVKRESGEHVAKYTAESIRYAVDMGAKIINMSLGGTAPSKAERKAVQYAQKKGVLIVAAAGNQVRNNDFVPFYPASYRYDNIISVGSLNQDATFSKGFSNFGINTVDILAPGSDILSTVPNNEYDYMTGTSQATPFVTGIAAKIWSMHPEWDYKQVRKHLLDSAAQSPVYKDKVKVAGRLNALLALKSFKKVKGLKNKAKYNEGFVNTTGKITHNSSCALCGHRILCGAIDAKITYSVNSLEMDSNVKRVCAEKNEYFEIKGIYGATQPGDNIFFDLKNELLAISKDKTQLEYLLKYGFTYKSLYKAIGPSAIKKHRSINLVLPLLSEKDFISKRELKDKKHAKVEYKKYLDSLLNAHSSQLYHRGNGIYTYSDQESKKVLEKMAHLLPVADYSPGKVAAIIYDKLPKALNNPNLPVGLISKIEKALDSNNPKDDVKLEKIAKKYGSNNTPGDKTVSKSLNQGSIHSKFIAKSLPEAFRRNKKLINSFKAVTGSDIRISHNNKALPAPFKTPRSFNKKQARANKALDIAKLGIENNSPKITDNHTADIKRRIEALTALVKQQNYTPKKERNYIKRIYKANLTENGNLHFGGNKLLYTDASGRVIRFDSPDYKAEPVTVAVPSVEFDNEILDKPPKNIRANIKSLRIFGLNRRQEPIENIAKLYEADNSPRSSVRNQKRGTSTGSTRFFPSNEPIEDESLTMKTARLHEEARYVDNDLSRGDMNKDGTFSYGNRNDICEKDWYNDIQKMFLKSEREQNQNKALICGPYNVYNKKLDRLVRKESCRDRAKDELKNLCLEHVDFRAKNQPDYEGYRDMFYENTGTVDSRVQHRFIADCAHRISDAADFKEKQIINNQITFIKYSKDQLKDKELCMKLYKENANILGHPNITSKNCKLKLKGLIVKHNKNKERYLKRLVPVKELHKRYGVKTFDKLDRINQKIKLLNKVNGFCKVHGFGSSKSIRGEN